MLKLRRFALCEFLVCLLSKVQSQCNDDDDDDDDDDDSEVMN